MASEGVSLWCHLITIKMIKEISSTVKQILKQIPACRDNDNLLISIIWEEQLRDRAIDPAQEGIDLFFKEYSEGKLASAESVRRTRQKLQQHDKSLRGSKYEERQYLSIEVSKEVSDISFEAIIQNKYEQITPEIFATLKEGDEVYFTHPEPTIKFHIPNHYANTYFTLGKKYTLSKTDCDALFLFGDDYKRYKQWYVNYYQFSILKRKNHE